jgi:DNA-binding beta-propeller fold protein YncE
LLSSGDKKKKKKAIMPSSIGIHPLTGEIYITDGPKSRLAILQPSGKILKVIELGKEFAQPEGVSFSPSGDLFISNEGTSKPGNIIELKLESARK